MSINISVPEGADTPELKPRITVLGVGGAGGNAVNNMISKELQGVDFVVANTDAQALVRAKTDRRVQLGQDVTEGLGAGSRPDVGRISAEESLEKVMAELDGAHMCFVAAGMGGGTGTGAAPVIAKAAKERGILTVAVVTKPFQFEGSHRMRIAEAGIQDLESYVDTLIIIPNQNLFRIANENTTFADAFAMADEVLYSGVRGVTDLMTMPGLINLDFADIRSVMGEMGKAMMGTGEAQGERRALEAAEAAINNPLLDDSSMKGAKGVLINITGGMDITLFEVDEAANRIRDEVDNDAHIIIGSAFDQELDGLMRVSVVATGIDAIASEQPRPQVLTVSERVEPRTVKPEAPKAQTPEPARRVPAAQPAPAAAEGTPKPAAAAGDTAVDKAEAEDDAQIDLEDAPAFEIKDAPRPAAAAAEVEEEAESDLKAVADEAAEETEDDLTAELEEAPKPAAAAAAEEEAPKPAAAAEEPETPVAATPKVGATDAFIPKPAAGVDEDKREVAEKADPMAEADLINGGKEPEEKKPAAKSKSSLFELVTGTGKAAIDRVTGSGQRTETPQPAASNGEPKAERIMTPSGGGGSRAAVGQAGPQAMPQPTLGGLDPEDRIQESADEDDDMLDIPAFLRRQAN
ncbi:MAG: cell division protein FtsZ [Rhodospirillales bacterium]|nr:cell division protein FtsZ [Rhodospirillales bacterium]MBO6787233.1 cell division protein FtsZ [Rhodospirillales bacterium]